jgi:hypothetical protein
VTAVLAQELRHIFVALRYRPVQRRIAVVILGIDLGFAGQQQFRNVLAAMQRRPVQRR